MKNCWYIKIIYVYDTCLLGLYVCLYIYIYKHLSMMHISNFMSKCRFFPIIYKCLIFKQSKTTKKSINLFYENKTGNKQKSIDGNWIEINPYFAVYIHSNFCVKCKNAISIWIFSYIYVQIVEKCFSLLFPSLNIFIFFTFIYIYIYI